MKPKCLNLKCSSLISVDSSDPKSSPIIRKGSFYRRSDSRWIKRFQCKACGLTFSSASFSPCYRQKKRRINFRLNELFCSGVSQRRAASILKVDPKTIVRRFRFLADQARLAQVKDLEFYQKDMLTSVQFDDLETSEHTKCKPLSVALAVDPRTRKILNFQVNKMPAKGLLARKAFKKYGFRPDERAVGWEQLMKSLQSIVVKDAIFTSDENPHYPKFVGKYFPDAKHLKTKGGRGAVTGQGELKKLHFDPLFALNHTCAMLRANLNRLFRRTWCTTKTIKGLLDHLALYVVYHNRVLTASSTLKGGS